MHFYKPDYWPFNLWPVCCSSHRLSISYIDFRLESHVRVASGFIDEHAGDTECINGHELKAKFTALSTSCITHEKRRQGRWRGRWLSAVTEKEIEERKDTIVVAWCIKKRRHRRDYDTFWLFSDKGAVDPKRDDRLIVFGSHCVSARSTFWDFFADSGRIY